MAGADCNIAPLIIDAWSGDELGARDVGPSAFPWFDDSERRVRMYLDWYLKFNFHDYFINIHL